MPRNLQNPVPGTTGAFLASWNAAISDITSTDTTASPIIFPVQQAAFLFCTFGSNDAASNAEFHLIVEDITLRTNPASPATTDASIIAVIPGIGATTPTARRQRADNLTLNIFIGCPVMFDLRSVPKHSNIRFFLACAALNIATIVYLHSYQYDERSM